MLRLLHGDITEVVLKCFYKVGNTLGHGFLELVYRNAMFIELTERGLQVVKHPSLAVQYAGRTVGAFEPDLMVENKVILELRAARAIDPSAVAQTLNYLRASEVEVGLILNFGEKLEFQRVVFENARKKR